MSTNGSGIPDPLISDTAWAVLAFLVVIGLIGGVLWILWAAPCSWFAASSILSVPARCIKELTQ